MQVEQEMQQERREFEAKLQRLEDLVQSRLMSSPLGYHHPQSHDLQSQYQSYPRQL